MGDILSRSQSIVYEMEKNCKNGVGNISAELFFDETVLFDDVYEAICKLISINEELHTKIEFDGEIPIQVKQINSLYKPERVCFDSQESYNVWKIKQNIVPLKLSETLYRFFCVSIGSITGVFYQIHPIICDRSSIIKIGRMLHDIINNNIVFDYKPYSVYLKKELEYMSGEQAEIDLKYWSQLYDNNPETAYIKENQTQNSTAAQNRYSLSVSDREMLEKYCNDNSLSPHIVIMSGIAAYFKSALGKNNFYIGTTVDNNSGDYGMGCFENTIPISINVSDTVGFTAFADIVSDSYKSASVHAGYAYIDFMHKLSNDFNQGSLYDVVVNYTELNADDAHCLPRTNITENMCITLIKCGKEYSIVYDYKIDLITSDEIKFLNDHITNLIRNGIVNEEKSVTDLEMILPDEYDLLLNRFNNTKAEYPDCTMIECFEHQVEKTPHNIAILSGTEQLTYSEFNMRANIIAHKLREFGVKPDDFVVLLTDRSIPMLTGIFGIIKSGGAYVPIDPTYPSERIDFILDDCKPKAIIRYTEENVELPDEIPVIDMSSPDVQEGCTDNPLHVNTPDDLIYCIYTSGTTGKPKGVMNRHKGLVNLVSWIQNVYPLDENDVILQKTTYVFDVSASEIFWWFNAGAKLALLKKDAEKEPDEIAAEIERYNATVIDFVPSMLSVFMNMRASSLSRISSLRYVLAAGEALSADLAKTFYSTMKKYGFKAVLGNIYGPTEASIYSTYYNLSPDFNREFVPIGKPIANMKAYIVNGKKLCGIGVSGELCIAGDGLARGYLNRPELNNEKFVVNLFGEGRMYHTGDLARWLPDGNIEYLGRIDEQVKIRGFRIEIGEIESRIREVDNVKECAVIARKDINGDNALYAYYTSRTEVSISEVRTKLAETLPDYMIPAYMMQIEKIPVTKNGKLDKRALPIIEAVTLREYVAPSDETEKMICDFFGEILCVENVGIKDGFFELGGHSLKATKLINMIEAKTGVSLPMREIFKNDTPEQLAVVVRKNTTDIYSPIPKAEEVIYYSMTSTQRRTYAVQQIQPESLAYNMPQTIKLTGNVDVEAMRSALQAMMERHEILRTIFLMLDGEPVQKVLEYVEADFKAYVSDKTDSELMHEFLKPFDLGNAPLIRVELVDKGDYHLFMIDMHHIISDGISMDIFMNELAEFYNGKTLSPLFRQFKDYSEWMRSRDLSDQEVFWRNIFEEDAPVLDMPTDFIRPQEQSFKGTRTGITIEEPLVSSIIKTAQRFGATEYMILLAALMVTLSKYSRQEDIVVGSPISGRTHRDTDEMIGMFVNTLAMRGRPESNRTFSEFLQEIKEMCLMAYENQEYPFDEIVNYLNIPRDPARNPLFDVMMVLQNTDDTKTEFSGLSMEYIENISVSAMFDLTFEIFSTGNQYKIQLEYCTDLFKKDTAERIVRHYAYILKQLIEAPDKKLGAIEMVTDDERCSILGAFNETALDYPKNKTITELFEEQVNLHPDKKALIFRNENLTYAEFNSKINCLAHYLRTLGIMKDDFVALIADRSIEMAVGIYGIVKSGGAYVPIDPLYPSDRIRFMLEDCKPKAIVKFTDAAVDLPDGIPVIDLHNNNIWNYSDKNPEHISKPNDLAYCIYTSGTTGRPKGVMIEHYGVANLREYFIRMQNVNENDNVIQFASVAFDAMVSEMTMGLLCGACMHIIPTEVQKDTALFESYLLENHITIAILPPIYLTQINISELRTIITAGSETNYDLVKRNSHIPVYSNDYGPTEATVCATYWKHNSSDEVPERIPIGKPMNNKQVYIMNGEALCGIGVPGELCIAGEGLARGYLNRPELTAEKFVKNPYGEGRMYRSGDLARWLPDGNIEYLGRIDEQVKIRGFRIELGEIESRIRELEEIRDCAVIARADSTGDKAIYAYYTSGNEVNAAEIREHLGAVLPEYMIPAYMMQIEEIPVTRNGKIDKRALPEIETAEFSEYVSPENELQETICKVFEDVLNIERVGICDRFIELGGDSIKAIRIISKLRELGYVVTVNEIMTEKTVQRISYIIERTLESKKHDQGEISGIVMRTPMIDLFNRMHLVKPEHFNQARIFTVTGIDNRNIRNAAEAVVRHHDMLRAVYRNGELEVLPVRESRLYDFYEFDYSEKTDAEKAVLEKCTEIQSSIDIEKGPIIKIVVFDLGKEKVMMICIHQLVVDSVSWSIIANDFNTVLQQLEYSSDIKLPDKTASFKIWSNEIHVKAENESDKFEITKINEEMQKYCNLRSHSNEGVKICNLKWSFDIEVSEKVLTELNETYHTNTEEILLSALKIAYSRWNEKNEITVVMESEKRESIEEELDISRTVGCFVTFYPAVLKYLGDNQQDIISVKETLRRNSDIYKHVVWSCNDFIPDFYFSYEERSSYGLKENSNFSCGMCSASENALPGIIRIKCVVKNNELEMEVSFDNNFFEIDKINELENLYNEALNEIIAHCTGCEEEITTISDLDASDLSIDDMDFINDFLSDLF